MSIASCGLSLSGRKAPLICSHSQEWGRVRIFTECSLLRLGLETIGRAGIPLLSTTDRISIIRPFVNDDRPYIHIIRCHRWLFLCYLPSIRPPSVQEHGKGNSAQSRNAAKEAPSRKSTSISGGVQTMLVEDASGESEEPRPRTLRQELEVAVGSPSSGFRSGNRVSGTAESTAGRPGCTTYGL